MRARGAPTRPGRAAAGTTPARPVPQPGSVALRLHSVGVNRHALINECKSGVRHRLGFPTLRTVDPDADSAIRADRMAAPSEDISRVLMPRSTDGLEELVDPGVAG